MAYNETVMGIGTKAISATLFSEAASNWSQVKQIFGFGYDYDYHMST